MGHWVGACGHGADPLSKRHLAAFVAHDPTVIKRDGEQRNTNFVRLGIAAYARPDARTSPYV